MAATTPPPAPPRKRRPLGRRLLLWSVGTALVAFGVVEATRPLVTGNLFAAHRQATAIELRDAAGRFLGIVPPQDIADRKGPGRGRFTPHGVRPDSIPPVWRACLIMLEDTRFDSVSAWFGVDPLAFPGVIADALRGLRRGGSTLGMQVVRMLEGRPAGGGPLVEVLYRKGREAIGAYALARHEAAGAPDLRLRLAAMHLPLVTGAPGSGLGDTVHGIVLAARVVFGVAPNELSASQQAVLAAAVNAPIVLAAPEDREGQRLARDRFARVKARASRCIEQLPDLSPQARATARTTLARMRAPVPDRPRALDPLLPRVAEEAFVVLANPVRRARAFAGEELKLLRPELDARLGRDWPDRLTRIVLTTDITIAAPARVRVADALLRVEHRLAPALQQRLVAIKPDDAAEVVILLADETGRLRVVVSSRDSQVARDLTPIGSLAKLAAAPALAATTPLDALVGDPPIPLRTAFAMSSTPAIEAALRTSVARTRLPALARALRLPVEPGADLPRLFAAGDVELTPSAGLRLVATVGHLALGSGLPAHMPRVVAEARGLDGGRTTLKDLPGAIEPRELPLLDVAGRAALQSLLAAPAEPGGTLAALAPLVRAQGLTLLAKTGTTSLAGATHALTVGGVVSRGGPPWTFLIVVSTRDARVPLGHRLVAGSLAPLVEALLPLVPAPPQRSLRAAEMR